MYRFLQIHIFCEWLKLQEIPFNLHKFKSLSAAVCTDQWYKYLPMSGVSSSTISHCQLQYALISGINIYLCQAFQLISVRTE